MKLKTRLKEIYECQEYLKLIMKQHWIYLKKITDEDLREYLSNKTNIKSSMINSDETYS